VNNMPSSARYTEMKHSGIEWVGNIPSHWSVKTLNQLVSQVKNKNSKLEEKNLLSLSYGKIKRKDINSSDGLLPASFDGYNIIEAGDIVLRLTDLQNDKTSLRVGLATECGIITSAYITLRPFDVKQSKYLYYLLHSFDIKKGFYGMGSGVRQGLNFSEVKELRIALPSQDEIEAVASYLDVKCAKIDEVILETKASIENYKLWRASIIFEAVTKGIDFDVKMKVSGIEWIGNIPANWNTRKIKHGFSIFSGATPKSDNPEYWDGDIIWITPADYKTEDMYVSEGRKNLTQLGYASCGATLVPAGSIIFSKRAPVGKVAINSKELCTNQGCLSCVPNETVSGEFFYYAMSAFTDQFELMGSGTTFKEISATSFANFVLPYPKIKEQHRIAKYLNDVCSHITSLITEKESLVCELEAYKQSLIHEVVTGKRKVV